MVTDTDLASATQVISEQEQIVATMKKHRAYFATHATKNIDFRIEQLKKLRAAIQANEKALIEALHKDLRKSTFESYATELSLIYHEIDKTIKKIKKWARPKKVGTPLLNFKSSSYLHKDPYGVVLIISPWNYPVQLLFMPLIGAMAAGNCVVLKPSEVAPNTSALVTKIIETNFERQYISIFEGGVPTSQGLLAQKFDYIFFTGSTFVGKIVYQAAAKHLTPVTLELGGKSPCIVDKDVDIKMAAKRIAWGKLINVGQTCIAPDYLYVHKDVKYELVSLIKKNIEKMYGQDPYKSKDLGRIISDKHVSRLQKMLSGGGDVIFGGEVNANEKYMAPTLMDNVSPEHAVMQEEIFGPILPIMDFEDVNEVINFVNEGEKPLALYIFSNNKQFTNKVLKETSSGDAAVNDVVSYMINDNLPFGGVGASGLGGYHGKFSFDTFSHTKSVTYRSNIIDPPVRYAPYKMSLGMLKTIFKFS